MELLSWLAGGLVGVGLSGWIDAAIGMIRGKPSPGSRSTPARLGFDLAVIAVGTAIGLAATDSWAWLWLGCSFAAFALVANRIARALRFVVMGSWQTLGSWIDALAETRPRR